MENEETVSDFAPKKLARQLDFSAPFCRASANQTSPSPSPLLSPTLPHSPLDLEFRLATRSSHNTSAQLQSSQWTKSPIQSFSRPETESPVKRIEQAVHKFLTPAIKLESAGSRPQFANQEKYITPQKPKLCNCRSSQCLKLYCECFAAGAYCKGCSCVNCHNNVENEVTREWAVGVTLERNPYAFRPKISISPREKNVSSEEAVAIQMVSKHNKGCQCKKTGCLKKYCECFQANIFCSETCKCKDCKNFEGSEERSALLHVELDAMANVNHAAISRATGSSGYLLPPALKKRKIDNPMDNRGRSIEEIARYDQENDHKSCAAAGSSLRSVPATCSANATVHRSSKYRYRDLLAQILQVQDAKGLCSLLVVVSAETRKKFSEREANFYKQPGRLDVKSSILDATQNCEFSQKNIIGLNDFPGHHRKQLQEKSNTLSESELHENGMGNCRPLYPGTQALLFDGKDAIFVESGRDDILAGNTGKLHGKLCNEYASTQVFSEQEKLVLSRFRDFVNKLIDRGNRLGSIQSQMQKSATGSLQNLRNHDSKAKDEAWKSKKYSSSTVQVSVAYLNSSSADTGVMSCNLDLSSSSRIQKGKQG